MSSQHCNANSVSAHAPRHEHDQLQLGCRRSDQQQTMIRSKHRERRLRAGLPSSLFFDTHTLTLRSRLARGVMCRRELCKVRKKKVKGQESGSNLFFLVYRRRRRCSISKGPHMCQCVSYYTRTLKQFNAPSAREQKTNQHVGSFQQKEAILLLPFCFHNTKARQKPDVHSPKKHKVYTLQPNLKGRKSAGPLTTQTSHVSFPLRTFPGTRCPGPCDNFMPPLPTPSPARREGDFVIGSMQSNDMQRLIVHVAGSDE